jgi:hypothetical protein
MRPLGTPSRRWEENIRMDPLEIGWGGVQWMHVAQNRNSGGLLYEYGNEPSQFHKIQCIY